MPVTDNLTLLESSKEALRVKLGLPKSLPFSEYYKHTYPYDPLELFSGTKQGVWFDPSDKSTLFQDAEGKMPVTRDGDPVGLMLDKSEGDVGAFGPNLVPNGNFFSQNTDDWFISTDSPEALKEIKNGRLHITTNTEGLPGYFILIIPTVVGKRYLLSADWTKTGEGRFYIGTSDNTTAYSSGVSNPTGYYTAISDKMYLQVGATSGVSTQIIGNISVKELQGNHAVQTISAARPVYKTDGILHWLEFDGVDDGFVLSFSTPIKPENSTCVGINAEKSGSYPFLLTQTSYNGKADWLLKPSQNLLTITQVSTSMDAAFAFGSANVISVDSGSALTVRNNGVQTATAPTSKISLRELFIGSQIGLRNYAKFKLYGMLVFEGGIYNSGADAYLAIKSGVTL